MTPTPPGWYPDPIPPPGYRPALRWWDGSGWTEHVVATPSPVAARPRQATTTPDGVRLASWGQRVGATLIDTLITTTLTLAAGFPFLLSLFRAFRTFFRQSIDSAQSGGQPLGQGAFYHLAFGPLVAFSTISLLVNVVYSVGFLKAWGATPGKLALGLRVRLREVPGPLSWATVGKHWVGQYGVFVVGLLPLVGSVVGLYSLLDQLWPLWDPNRQAIHDRVAATNVVVHRT